jgi:hypothetical protein
VLDRTTHDYCDDRSNNHAACGIAGSLPNPVLAGPLSGNPILQAQWKTAQCVEVPLFGSMTSTVYQLLPSSGEVNVKAIGDHVNVKQQYMYAQSMTSDQVNITALLRSASLQVACLSHRSSNSSSSNRAVRLRQPNEM